MRPMLMLSALLLLSGCSGLQPLLAPSADLVPKPVPISAEVQYRIPALMDSLQAPGPTVVLSRAQADDLLSLVVILHIEREKNRKAREALSKN